MSVAITKYKVVPWLNTKKPAQQYAIRVFVAGSGWIDVCEARKTCLFKTEKQAEAMIASMKRERDANGFKLPRTRAQKRPLVKKKKPASKQAA